MAVSLLVIPPSLLQLTLIERCIPGIRTMFLPNYYLIGWANCINILIEDSRLHSISDHGVKLILATNPTLGCCGLIFKNNVSYFTTIITSFKSAVCLWQITIIVSWLLVSLISISHTRISNLAFIISCWSIEQISSDDYVTKPYKIKINNRNNTIVNIIMLPPIIQQKVSQHHILVSLCLSDNQQQ